MDHFEYRNGELWCERRTVRELAAEFGTPLYLYSANTLREHYRRFAAAFSPLDPLICYSIKSCQNLEICRLMAAEHSGFDVVSGGELFRALKAGGDPAKIVFAGVGKTDREILEAIDAGIGWFNVESEAEMENLTVLARGRGTEVHAALRVNPDVDPLTHRYTSTGKRESKFGVDLERARRFFETYGRDDAVRLDGIHLHIGSPVNTIQPFVDAVSRALVLISELRAAGFVVNMLDVGGGYGAHYRDGEAPPAADYADALVPLLRDQGLTIVLEPGRSLTANSGLLVASVQYLKDSGDKQFVIIDAAMTELLRPALYEAYHFAWPVVVRPEHVPAVRGPDADLPDVRPVDIVGPVCESSDFLATGRRLPPVNRGDLVALFAAGAYGFVMASQYNSRPRPPEVLVDGDDVRVIRQRETYEDLVRGER